MISVWHERHLRGVKDALVVMFIFAVTHQSPLALSHDEINRYLPRHFILL